MLSRRSLEPALCAVLLGLLTASLAGAATWIVDPSGGGDATTIQQAVGLASAGDEIRVRPGTYPEQVTVDKFLFIGGESGADVTTIDAESARPYCLTTSATGAVLTGLTFTGVNAGYGYCTGIAAIEASNVTILACRIVENVSYRATVSLAGTSHVLDTAFLGNRGLGWGCGQVDPDHGTGCVWSTGTLTMERCLFENNGASDNPILDAFGDAVIRDSVFRGQGDYYGVGGLFMASLGGFGVIRLENNLFVDNDYPLLGQPWYTGGRQYRVEVVGNTFARNNGLFLGEPDLAPGSIFEANVFSGSDVGFWLPVGTTAVSVSCNDSWGNDTNWIGLDPAAGGNFSAPPRYCAPLVDDFTVASNSPLLPANNGCGVRIGAFGEGCGPISIESRSWGRIKGAYR